MINFKKTYYWFTIVAMALTVGSFAIILYAFEKISQPVEVLQVNNEPYPVLNQPLKAGQQLTIYTDVCKLTDASGLVTPMLVGEHLIYLPSFVTNIKQGCFKGNVDIGLLPLSIPEGTYTLRLVIEYTINPLRKEYKTVESEPFDIVGSPKILYLPI